MLKFAQRIQHPRHMRRTPDLNEAAETVTKVTIDMNFCDVSWVAHNLSALPGKSTGTRARRREKGDGSLMSAGRRYCNLPRAAAPDFESLKRFREQDSTGSNRLILLDSHGLCMLFTAAELMVWAELRAQSRLQSTSIATEAVFNIFFIVFGALLIPGWTHATGKLHQWTRLRL